MNNTRNIIELVPKRRPTNSVWIIVIIKKEKIFLVESFPPAHTRMFEPTRFLKYARGRLKLWADLHKDYVSFVAVFQELSETELAEYISHLRKTFTQHKFISSEIAFVRSAPVEYLDLVKKVKLCTETELDEMISFYDGVFALSEMSKKRKRC